ncbi:unnamed protein product, partial [Allacma fusca]
MRQTEAWRYGDYEGKVLADGDALGFTRVPCGPKSIGFLVLVNFSDKNVTVD